MYFMIPKEVQGANPRGVRKLAALAFLLLLLPTGCDQVSLPSFSSHAKPQALAEHAVNAGDFPAAVRLYESMLDGTDATAEVHYRLALIYDKNLSDPVSALHHFRRYQRMSAGTSGAIDVETFLERLERDVAQKLGEGGLVTRGEAIRLRNENNALREQLSALRGQKVRPATAVAPPVDRQGYSKVPQTKAAEAVVGQETRTYVVQRGDTLAAISRKFFNTSERWKDIADANQNQLQGGTNIREGQVLIIP